MDFEEINAAQVEDRIDASSMSSETLLMSLLGQIRVLEEERDNARFLAANMRERLQHVTKRNSEAVHSEDTASSFKSGGRGGNPGLEKLLREVMSNMVNDLQQITLNEEQRQHNLKQLAPCRRANCGSECEAFEDELGIYKEHYEKLLEEAEHEKAVLRKKLKNQQDLVLDRDIKIKELTSMLHPATADSMAAVTESN